MPLQVSDARLVLVLGSRTVHDDGTQEWEPGTQTYEGLVSAQDILKQEGTEELHLMLDYLLSRADKDRDRLIKYEQAEA